jgi:hypothetical protein
VTDDFKYLGRGLGLHRSKDIRASVSSSGLASLEAIAAAAGSDGCEIDLGTGWGSNELDGGWRSRGNCRANTRQATGHKHSLARSAGREPTRSFDSCPERGWQVQVLARALRCWNPVVEIDRKQPAGTFFIGHFQGASHLRSVFLANVAWRAAGPTPGRPSCGPRCSLCARTRCGRHTCCRACLIGGIEVKPVVGAARRAFCSLLRAHTSSPAADLCPRRHAFKYNTHMVLDGSEDGHAKLPVPAYVHAWWLGWGTGSLRCC